MNLDALATHLQAKNCGIVAESIFIGELPEDGRNGILLMGPYGGTPINKELRGYYVSNFRIVARSAQYDEGEALAKKASAAFDSLVDYTLPGMLVRQCLPVNLPRPYRKSVGGYWEFEVDMEIVFVDTTT